MVKSSAGQGQVEQLARELFVDNVDFIERKHIDEEKIKKYDRVLQILEERRDYWALNKELSPIDSIKIYGAYSTVYGILYGVAEALDLGVKRKENPKAAKEVYSILHETTELIPKLERVHLEKEKSKISSQLIAEIFDNSRFLRKQAISKQIIKAGEVANRKELVKELFSEIELNLT